MLRRAMALPEDDEPMTAEEIAKVERLMNRPNKKWRTFVCPECGRTTDTLSWSVMCRGKSPNWHESQRCKKVK